ncbi:hypothetical protein AMTRI_Chr13g125910 [Amborella trichopoda]
MLIKREQKLNCGSPCKGEIRIQGRRRWIMGWTPLEFSNSWFVLFSPPGFEFSYPLLPLPPLSLYLYLIPPSLSLFLSLSSPWRD